MCLPLRVLQLIKEYSRSVTRPDWQTFERIMDINCFICNIEYKYCKIKSPLYALVLKNMHASEFYISYQYIYHYGIDAYIKMFGGNKSVVLSNKILYHQQNLYLKHYFIL
jgi:hypothetical protein